MSCIHCKMQIKQALKQLPGIHSIDSPWRIDISVSEKHLEIGVDFDKSNVIRQIQSTGYSGEEIT